MRRKNNRTPASWIMTISGLVLAGSALSGCSPSSAVQASAPLMSQAEFWGAYSATSAQEINPPANLNDLVNDAEVIVVGPIEAVSTGPVRIDRLPEGDITNESTILTVKVNSTIKGSVGETVKVWMSGPAPVEDHSSTEIQGTDSTTWFLEPSGNDDLYIMSSVLGTVGPNGNGEVVTLRSPEESPVIVEEAASSDPAVFIDEVVAATGP